MEIRYKPFFYYDSEYYHYKARNDRQVLNNIYDSLPEVAKEIIDSEINSILKCYLEEAAGCESPIEQAFALEMYRHRIGYFYDRLWQIDENLFAYFHRQNPISIDGNEYFADFGIIIGYNKDGQRIHLLKYAVELDGHEFHEKTKEQAGKDKARERDLVNAGYRVIRFTGSEVFKGVGYCVSNLFNIIASNIEELDLNLYKHIEPTKEV